MDGAVRAKVEQFFSVYPSRDWPEHQILIHPEDKPPGVYLLEEGSIRQYTIDYRGNDVVVNVFHAPAFIPMMCAFTRKPSKYFFETTEQVKTRLAPADDVLQFVREHPDVSYDLLARLYSGIDGVLTRMVQLMSGTAYTRILHELIVQAERLHPGKNSNTILPLKEYQIGTYCGLSRETVSREFKKLKKRNLVDVTKFGLVIHSPSKLKAELEKHT